MDSGKDPVRVARRFLSQGSKPAELFVVFLPDRNEYVRYGTFVRSAEEAQRFTHRYQANDQARAVTQATKGFRSCVKSV
jgi:hypothetical protein